MDNNFNLCSDPDARIIGGRISVWKPAIVDNRKIAGAKYSGSYDIYVHDKGSLETVYITKVIYNNPATIVFWSDGTKTLSKCSGKDIYSEETGLIYCILKKLSTNNIDKLFDEWLPTQKSLLNDPIQITLKDIRQNAKR